MRLLTLALLFMTACPSGEKRAPDLAQPKLAHESVSVAKKPGFETVPPPCGGETDPHGWGGDPIGQRACCAGEIQDPPCKLGFSPSKTYPLDIAPRTDCNPVPNGGRTARSIELCRCSDGIVANSTCVHSTKDPTVSCRLNGAPNLPIAMSLYVTGLNHSRWNSDEGVAQDGVDQLAAAILESASSPENIVIAIDASNPTFCNRGNKPDDEIRAHNGACLAQKLEELSGRSFKHGPWWYWIALPGGGSAGPTLITGSRWTPGPSDKKGKAMGVLLQDTTYVRGRVPLYIFHAGTPFAANMQPVIDDAGARDQSDQFAPLFVGDFNMGYSEADGGAAHDDSLGMLRQLKWLNRGLSCAGGDGFNLDGNLIQIESGWIPDDAPNPAPRVMFAKALGAMRPVNFKYSKAPNGHPTSTRSGIWLPGIDHNVVGFDLAYSRNPSLCSDDQLAAGFTEARGRCLKTCAAQHLIPKGAAACPTGTHVTGAGSDDPYCCERICSPAQQSDGWAPKGDRCLPPCKDTPQSGRQCSPGYAFVSFPWDADVCCEKIPICSAAQTAAGYKEKNGHCLKSCQMLGGKCPVGPRCRVGTEPSDDKAYNCDPCCKPTNPDCTPDPKCVPNCIRDHTVPDKECGNYCAQLCNAL